MAKPLNQMSAIEDIMRGIGGWRLWLYLANFDIRGRYRRTVIGPMWTALNSLLFALIIAVVYSAFWGTPLADFLPYVASGYFVWIFISTCFLEGCNIYVLSSGFLKAAPISPITFNMRVATRNLIVFFHSLVVYVLLALPLGVDLTKILWMLPGLAVLYVFLFSVGVFLAVLCARYRDVEQVITSLILAAFFVTPILYDTSMVDTASTQSVLRFNFFTYFLEIVRDPMLGRVPDANDFIICVALTIVAFLGALAAYAVSRRKLYLWI